MAAFPPMLLFHDVPVAPASRNVRSKGSGGPVWPDFDRQVAARFCRDGIPSDSRPPVPAKLHRIEGPAVWGGFLIRQFGHLVAEHLTRLPQSVMERPDDLYLFTLEPGETRDSLPGYIWDVLGWFGVRPGRTRLVNRGFLAPELRVAAQGEMLGKQPTPAAYLDRLQALARRNRLEPVRAEIVFVTRAGMVAAGKGGHAGEGYLADALARCGVRVFDPGRATLREQLAVYAGASVLVFSEGSAQHGRCLLGRLPQDMHVLRRRSRRNTAITQLRARCQRIAYHETVAASLGTATEARGSRVDLVAAVYDVAVLFALFGTLGVDLAGVWDDRAYRAAARADIAGWMAAHPVSAAQHAANLAALAAVGLDDGLDTNPPGQRTGALPQP